MTFLDFHEDELLAQALAGQQRGGRAAIRPFMPDQHREFFALLPYLLVATLDAQGWPMATVLTGAPGFIRSPDAVTLHISALPAPGDPAAPTFTPEAEVGLIGLDFRTRRRNRANGFLAAVDDGLTVGISQSFGNCPQYIQARVPWLDSTAYEAGGPVAREETASLSDQAAALAARVDTFFIASAAPDAGSDAAHGVDISHRGGRPGFVRVERGASGTRLTIPDFRGNFYFNTLGNIAANPRAGLILVDFDSGDLLTLTGPAMVIWDGPEVAAFVGAERLLRVEVERGLYIRNAVPLRWSAPEYAPQLARTGTWDGRTW